MSPPVFLDTDPISFMPSLCSGRKSPPMPHFGFTL